MNKDAKRYLRAVRGWLPCSGELKRRIMAQITNRVQEYLTQNPKSTFDEICAQFGSPQEIAVACVENTDTAEILKNLRIRRRIVTIVVSAVLVILISWATVITFEIAEFRENIPDTIVVVTDVVEESSEG